MHIHFNNQTWYRYQYRWYIAIAFYAALTAFLYWCDMNPLLQSWHQLQAEVKERVQTSVLLREQVEKIRIPFSQRNNQLDQANVLAVIVKLINQNNYHLEAIDVMGEMATRYGSADTMVIALRSGGAEVSKIIDAMQQSLPSVVITDLQINDAQQASIKIKLLLFGFHSQSVVERHEVLLPFCSLRPIYMPQEADRLKQQTFEQSSVLGYISDAHRVLTLIKLADGQIVGMEKVK